MDPNAIEQYEIAPVLVANAIRNRSIRATAGSFESYSNEKNLVTLTQFDDPQEVGDVVVRSSFTSPQVRVSDVAQVNDTFEEPRIITRINGQPAIMFQVLKNEEADVIRTVDRVKAMAAEQEKIFPEGVKILFTDDSSRYVSNRFNVVLNNGAIGLVLVMLILALFLNLRTAFGSPPVFLWCSWASSF